MNHDLNASRAATPRAGLYPFCIALGLLAGPLATLAAPPDVADPAVSVPPAVYRSVFSDVARGVEAPSTDWRTANKVAGQFGRGHIDILRAEAAGQARQAPPPAAAPAQPLATTPHEHSGHTHPGGRP